tara:strand:- start:144 stop:644 length:501 start_codon:yes stop_codon:yes gene_type:complete
MRRGIHTIRGGFTESKNPSIPRKYTLDNGDWQSNMHIDSFEVIYTNVRDTQEAVTGHAIFVVLAASEEGATPLAYGTEDFSSLGLRLNDNRIIGYACMDATMNPIVLLDPDHIIPGDLYINAWEISSAGTLSGLSTDIGFMVKMKRVQQSGNDALMSQIKETSYED